MSAAGAALAGGVGRETGPGYDARRGEGADERVISACVIAASFVKLAPIARGAQIWRNAAPLST
jgi:hypothetical protein